MGPAYHKGVPLLGVPGITLDTTCFFFKSRKYWYKLATSTGEREISKKHQTPVAMTDP